MLQIGVPIHHVNVAYVVSVDDAHRTIVSLEPEVNPTQVRVQFVKEGDVVIFPLESNVAEWREIEAWGGLPH